MLQCAWNLELCLPKFHGTLGDAKLPCRSILYRGYRDIHFVNHVRGAPRRGECPRVLARGGAWSDGIHADSLRWARAEWDFVLCRRDGLPRETRVRGFGRLDRQVGLGRMRRPPSTVLAQIAALDRPPRAGKARH